jgi:zinc transporter 9
MMSEAIHSLADTMNQCLLLIGIRRSQKKGTGPVGNYREAYVWALISSVGIFFLGAGVTIHHGITGLIHHESELTDDSLAMLVLAISFLIEFTTLVIAIRSVKQSAKAAHVSLSQFIIAGSDPTAVAVVLEDGVAVLGVIVAAACIAATKYTHNEAYDSAGSIIIGTLLAFVASFLINKNSQLLTGVSINQKQMTDFSNALKDHPGVKHVKDLRGELIGLGVCRLKADIEFRGRYIGEKYLTEHKIEDVFARVSVSPKALADFLLEYSDLVVERVGDIIDDIEKTVQQNVPGSVFIDIEPE